MALLDTVNSPEDLQRLAPGALPWLCAELRKKIIETTLKNGGHLASSLGAVELIVALLRTFNFREDRIVFDVGHQTYAYKLLTGRKDRFDTLRRQGGLSGYPKRDESPFDHFDVGHSSTSLSAALGYAKARDLRNENHHVVAVIGDGSLLNGMAMEALNHARETRTRLIIVLNDNEMSINHRVGGIANHLARLSVNPSYRRLKDAVKEQCRALTKGEGLEDFLGRIKSHLKTFLQPTNLFEELDISYWGPFDGHDTEELEMVLRLAQQFDKPLLLHVITRKGKGYAPAEENPAKFHGVSPAAPKTSGEACSWSKAAADAVTALAEKDPRVVCLTAAMKEGTALGSFAQRFPDRFFDVGIAEEHMLTFAAGMAAGGLRPVVFIYSTFLQRAVDQLVHDIALPRLPVILAVDRAGVVGDDGETHQGVLDIAWGKAVPHLTMGAPRDICDLKEFFSRGMEMTGPLLVRYPRGRAPERIARDEPIPAWGKAQVLRMGDSWAVAALGNAVPIALEAHDLASSRGIPRPTVVDLRFIKPLDDDVVAWLLKSHKTVLTMEDGFVTGGMGEALAARAGNSLGGGRVFTLGVPDRFIPHATVEEQQSSFSMTAEGLLEAFAHARQA